MPPARPRPAAAVIAALACVLSVLAGLPTPADASIGSDRFFAGQAYHGEFGAPSLLLVGSTYYVFGTNTDGDNLPVMTSSDMTTWYARRAWPLSAGYSTWAGYNDAMPHPARWARYYYDNTGKARTGMWAPSVAKIGSRYVIAYAVPMPGTTGRHCISIGYADNVLGAYRDTSTKPLECSSDPMGSIDPQVLVTPTGAAYLIWKNAGVPGRVPTKIWSRRLNAAGSAFAVGSHAHFLLQTGSAWEGNVIEAPAMQFFRGRWYLFYSGNRYVTASYAIGYARCRGPLGPCSRASDRPLLASGSGIAGPGAATAVVDLTGALRLAYSAWDAGHVGYPTSSACQQTAYGCNQRRLHIATVSADRRGLLHVVARG